MTRYLRTCGGHTMTVHAPRPGELDPAALAAFTAAEPVLGLDVETSAIDDHGPRFFAPGFTVRLVQFGSEREAWVLDMADPGQRDAAAAVLADPARRFVTHTPLTCWRCGPRSASRSASGWPTRTCCPSCWTPMSGPGTGSKSWPPGTWTAGSPTLRPRCTRGCGRWPRPGTGPGTRWLRWGWNHLPADDEAYVVYAGLDAIYARRLLPVLLTACGPFAHLARLDTWLAAQATGITVRGLRLDTGYTRGLLADLEAEHAAADARITAALGCPGRSPRFAEWLDCHAAAAGITGLPAPRPAGCRSPPTRLASPAGRARRHGALPAGAAELVTGAAGHVEGVQPDRQPARVPGRRRPRRAGAPAGQHAARQDSPDEHHQPGVADAQEARPAAAAVLYRRPRPRAHLVRLLPGGNPGGRRAGRGPDPQAGHHVRRGHPRRHRRPDVRGGVHR